MSSRRTFLRALAAGAAAAPLAVRLRSIDQAFAADVKSLANLAADPRALRERYLLSPEVTYLNHASIGTVPRAVHEARCALQATCESNPWLHIFGGGWEEARETVRAQAADLLGASAADVAITHNTTEGFNVLARGLPLEPGDEVLFPSTNHDGASVCWHHVAAERGITVRAFDFPIADAAGLSAGDVVQLFADQIRPETRVLAFPHIDNLVGLRLPMAEVTRTAHELGVEFVVVDGAQAAGMVPLDLPAAGVDAYAASPHKWVQSPKGLGLLYVKPSVRERLRPMWVTWGQRRWAGTVRTLEDYGTRDMPEVLALGDALAFQEALGHAAKVDAYRSARRRFQEAVDAAPGLTWRSPRSWDLGSMLFAVGLTGADSPEVGARLYREHGVVVRAFGAPALNSLRVSPNLATTDEELERFLRLVSG